MSRVDIVALQKLAKLQELADKESVKAKLATINYSTKVAWTQGLEREAAWNFVEKNSLKGLITREVFDEHWSFLETLGRRELTNYELFHSPKLNY